MNDDSDKHIKDKKIELIRRIRQEKMPYVLQQRRYGEGEMRLGCYIE